MKTTARIEMPTGVRIAPDTPANVNAEQRGGTATFRITNVEKSNTDPTVLHVTIELDADLELLFWDVPPGMGRGKAHAGIKVQVKKHEDDA